MERLSLLAVAGDAEDSDSCKAWKSATTSCRVVEIIQCREHSICEMVQMRRNGSLSAWFCKCTTKCGPHTAIKNPKMALQLESATTGMVDCMDNQTIRVWLDRIWLCQWCSAHDACN
eukprot:6099875-Amphidinium_carterae.1